MEKLIVGDIVFHNGNGIALIIVKILGPLAFCKPVNSLQNAEGIPISELVKVKKLLE